MYEIEKGIPLPGLNTKYPFEKMEVGDSFFIENPIKDNRGNPLSLSGQANQRYGGKKRFAQRKEGSGIRIWRIE